jgi:hypothetical protein
MKLDSGGSGQHLNQDARQQNLSRKANLKLLSAMTTTMTTFKHSPLDDSKDEIGLLELQPGQRGQLLNIHLRQTRLSDLPTYEALSYM